MNDNDLERQLRTQAGPREQGYVPTRLPTSLEDAASARRQPLLTRAAVLLPAAAAGILVVAVASAVLTRGNGNGIGGGGETPQPTATASIATEPVACTADDLALASEPWGGAAGSRGTVVTVSLKEGRAACLLSTGASGRIVDANREILIGSIRLLMRFPDVLIRPGERYTIGVTWSNWCGEPPARPLSLEIQFDNIPEWMVASEPVSEPDPVPPCMGESSPGNLSLTQLQPAP